MHARTRRLATLAAASLVVGLGACGDGSAKGDGTASSDGPVGVADRYPGARALVGDSPTTVRDDVDAAITRDGEYGPRGKRALKDTSEFYDDACMVKEDDTSIKDDCTYGATDGDVEVAVLGDSKMAQWHNALVPIAEREGWRYRYYTKSACPFSIAEGLPKDCQEFDAKVVDQLLEDPPDIAFVSSVRSGARITKGYAQTLGRLEKAGTKVVVVDDNPSSVEDPDAKGGRPDCLADQGPDYVETCGYSPFDGAGSASLRGATEALEDEVFLELDPWICPSEERCPPVVGQVAVFREGSHLTDSYVRTLGPVIDHLLHDAGVTTQAPAPLDP